MGISIERERCTGCNLCVFLCPVHAISCYAGARIDRIACNKCMKCVNFCPVDAICRGNEG